MFWFDLVLLICLVAGIIKGLADGLVKQVIALFALVIAVYLSGFVAGLIRDFINRNFDIGDAGSPFVLSAVYYMLAFVLILSGLLALGNLINKAINYTPIGIINRLFGAIFGGLITILCLSIVLNIFAVFDPDSAIIPKQMKEKSVHYNKVKDVFPKIYPSIKELF